MPSVQTHVRDVGLFQSLGPLYSPWSDIDQAKPDGLGHIDTRDSDLMHHQYRLSVPQWNPGPALRNPHQYHRSDLWTVSCGFTSRSQRSCPAHLRSVHCVHWQHGPRHLAQQGHLRARPYGFSASSKTPQAKVRGGMVLFIVRGQLRRPSLSGAPTVTFCSVHIHNVVDKKRDASTDLPRRLPWVHAAVQRGLHWW